MDNYVWLLGGGIMARPMAQEIKQRGYNLLLTDINPECVCRELADQFAVVDVYNYLDNLKYAKTLDNKPQAVLTAGTDAGVEVSWLCWHFGLPAVDPDTARQVRDKSLMRTIFHVNHPVGRVVSHSKEPQGWNVFPCVVKSATASGSRGLSFVKRSDELQPAVVKAIAANRAGGGAIIEELLIGEDLLPDLKQLDSSEVALDFLVEYGRPIYLNGALRLFWHNRPGIEAGHLNPFEPDEEIMTLARQAVKALGVEQGPFKMDLKRDKRYGWCLLETSTRLSGGYDHMYSAPLATGKDITGVLLDYALGLPLDDDKLVNNKGRHACVYAPLYSEGPIIGWEDKSKATTFIVAQEEIKELSDNSQRPLFVMVDGETPLEAYEAAKKAGHKVKPVYAG